MGDLGVRRQGQQQHSGRQHRVPRARASSPYASSATGRGGGGSQSPSRRSAAAVNVYVTQPHLASPVLQPQWERKQAEAAERCVEPLPQLPQSSHSSRRWLPWIIMMAAEARWRHSVNNGHQLDNRSVAVARTEHCSGLSQAGTAFLLCVYNAVGWVCGCQLTLSLYCPVPVDWINSLARQWHIPATRLGSHHQLPPTVSVTSCGVAMPLLPTRSRSQPCPCVPSSNVWRQGASVDTSAPRTITSQHHKRLLRARVTSPCATSVALATPSIPSAQPLPYCAPRQPCSQVSVTSRV